MIEEEQKLEFLGRKDSDRKESMESGESTGRKRMRNYGDEGRVGRTTILARSLVRRF